jgi:hypothetical protein
MDDNVSVRESAGRGKTGAERGSFYSKGEAETATECLAGEKIRR